MEPNALTRLTRVAGKQTTTLTHYGRKTGKPHEVTSGGTVVTAPKSSIKERFSRYREIKLSVTGRKSGKTISMPVWFVLESEKLYLLPVKGSDTQWYKNVLQNPSIRIDARGEEAAFQAAPVTATKAVKSVIEKFREKYGANDVKKYYSNFDVAVLAELG